MSPTLRALAAACLALCAWQSRAADATALLKAADRYRIASEDVQVDIQIDTAKPDGTVDKQRRYTVFSQSGHRSLVLMQSPAERGQKVLMLGDDFWLLMPSSQRPLRITPSQKLLGDASTGDVATLRWADDYTAELVGEERCGDTACLHLALTAARKGVTYQRIGLWIGADRHEPLRADLYVQSEKLAKQARFVMDRPAAPSQMSEMVLVDQLANGRETRVRYLARKDRSVPEAWLNPMYLARNPALE
jgi:hypothetical protein